MKFVHVFHAYILLSMTMLALVASHAVTPDDYWKSVLPNSPMPKAIKEILVYTPGWTEEKYSMDGVGNDGVQVGPFVYNYTTSADQLKDNPNVALFFLEKDLHQGREMKLHFMKGDESQKPTFLPREVTDSMPFSSNELPQIYHKFSIKPNSVEAEIMKQTLSECEDKGIEGEEKNCATSLESMVDFSISKLGKKVTAVSTEVNVRESTPLQKYRIEGAKKLEADKDVVCHKQNYAYAVFYCHKTDSTMENIVSLVGADGTKAKAVAVCHTDTSRWNPEHLAFQVLKVKPGSVPVCHFLPQDHVVWFPYQ